MNKHDTKYEIIFELISVGLKHGIDFKTITKIAGETFDYKVTHRTDQAKFIKGDYVFDIYDRSVTTIPKDDNQI